MLIENMKKLIKKGDNIMIISYDGLIETAITKCIEHQKDFTIYFIDNTNNPDIKERVLDLQ